MNQSDSAGKILTDSEIAEFVKKGFNEVHSSADLVHFHSINKFLLMAYNLDHTRLLGNIVANHDGLSLGMVLEKYDRHLSVILQSKPTVKLHTNVLQKIFGYFKKDLTSEEKSEILTILSEYRQGEQTLNDVLVLLEKLTRKFQKTYLVRQTYFLLYSKVSKSND